MNINVETRWKIWACEPGIFGFHLHPPLLHTPFKSSWCYIIVNDIFNENTWLKRWACQTNQPRKIRMWEFLGIYWRMGLTPPKKWTPSLADECLPHQERGSPRLGEPYTRRVPARSWPTLNHYILATGAPIVKRGIWIGSRSLVAL